MKLINVSHPDKIVSLSMLDNRSRQILAEMSRLVPKRYAVAVAVQPDNLKSIIGYFNKLGLGNITNIADAARTFMGNNTGTSLINSCYRMFVKRCKKIFNIDIEDNLLHVRYVSAVKSVFHRVIEHILQCMKSRISDIGIISSYITQQFRNDVSSDLAIVSSYASVGLIDIENLLTDDSDVYVLSYIFMAWKRVVI